ncbi:hypothetical protein MWN33_18600 [Starkeya koreensis]|uniref:Uncharacterized protein n=1 Tax=Ancylobacter koreensis TaxID=266121 RepID=A0ABT0DSD0_9HYPH|nr:hypothetical protein [Ancylobacter koreensis]MCK0210047.1 hypothetical protein [Ancylobacter koreensis]
MNGLRSQNRFRAPYLAAAGAAALFLVAIGLGAGGTAHAAVVYCTGPGVPVGCVVRPTPYVAPAPAARAAVYCTRPGYPVGCVGGVGAPGVGAPGVGVAGTPATRAVARPGPGVNGGGPVNRPGLR